MEDDDRVDDDEPANSPLKFLLIAAGPLLVILTGIVIVGGEWMPRFLLITFAVLAAVAITGLTVLVLLVDGFRRRHYFRSEYFWLAALLVAFLVANLVLLMI